MKKDTLAPIIVPTEAPSNYFAAGSLPQGMQGSGMARDGPQAVPSDLVCVCGPVGRYFTSVKPALPSGPMAYTLACMAAFISSRSSQAPKA